MTNEKIIFDAHITLSVKPENAYIITVFAETIWWHKDMGMEAKDYIIQYMKWQFEKIRKNTEIGLQRYHGEAGKENIQKVLDDYDESVDSDVTISIWNR